MPLPGVINRFGEDACRFLGRVESHGILRVDEVGAELRLALKLKRHGKPIKP